MAKRIIYLRIAILTWRVIYHVLTQSFYSSIFFPLQLKKLYPDLHLKLPGKRLLGNNFDPGEHLGMIRFST